MHEIKIKKVNRGFIVTVGCQTFVFEQEKELFTAISEYFKDPEKAKKKYINEKEIIVEVNFNASGQSQEDFIRRISGLNSTAPRL
jgi:hypothetical protein